MPSLAIPNCPITQQPLKDPVMDPEGNTYERSAIIEWLQIHQTSPITRNPLRVDQLVVNRALKDLIEGTSAQSSNESQIDPGNVAPQLDSSQINVSHWSHDDYIGINIASIDSQKSHPVHINCVIDISGSMGNIATIGSDGSDGLTLLDLVKHATLTIIESLGDNDMLSIVSFSDDAILELEPTPMNKAGKVLAKNSLNQLQPTASTYISKGIKLGIETCAKVSSNYFTSIFVLTDGIPSDQMDYKSFLKRQLDANPCFGSINTFGFGYSLDTPMLQQIALQGGGSYSFIPDASMLGTIFVNALSNAKTVYGVQAKLKIRNAASLKVIGNFDYNQAVESLDITLQSLRYGQNSTIILKGDISDNFQAQLNFQGYGGKIYDIQSVIDSQVENSDMIYHIFRSELSQNLLEVANEKKRPVLTLTPRSQISIPPQVQSLRQTNKDMEAICKDVEGQVHEALSRDDWFNRWGKHYLVSLSFAHMFQVCNNFKDPGVQAYGKGYLFKKYHGILTDKFLSLPAPKPSVSHYRGSQSSGSASVNMSRYINSSGICFHSEVKVRLADGYKCKIIDLNKGDLIQSDDGYTEVECVVVTKLSQQVTSFFKVGDQEQLIITPYHPIIYGGEWRFPINVYEKLRMIQVETDFVVSIITIDRNPIKIDGVVCISLGHGIEIGDAKHEYFGTEKVINDLKKIKGYQQGMVVIENEWIKRDKNGKVSQIIMDQ